MIIIIDFKRKILTTPMYLTNKEGWNVWINLKGEDDNDFRLD